MSENPGFPGTGLTSQYDAMPLLDRLFDVGFDRLVDSREAPARSVAVLARNHSGTVPREFLEIANIALVQLLDLLMNVLGDRFGFTSVLVEDLEAFFRASLREKVLFNPVKKVGND
jgi:hypothetical protein